jgi:hypothetical protein
MLLATINSSIILIALDIFDPRRSEPGSAGAAMSLRWLVSLYRVRARLRCGRSRPPRKES